MKRIIAVLIMVAAMFTASAQAYFISNTFIGDGSGLVAFPGASGGYVYNAQSVSSFLRGSSFGTKFIDISHSNAANPMTSNSGTAYLIDNSTGGILTTQDFVTFSSVTTTSISDNGGRNYFYREVFLHHDGTYLYAIGLPQQNSGFYIWRSSDGGVTFTTLSNPNSTAHRLWDFIVGSSYIIIPADRSAGTVNGYYYINKSTMTATWVTTSRNYDQLGFYRSDNTTFYLKTDAQIGVVTEATPGTLNNYATNISSPNKDFAIAYNATIGKFVLLAEDESGNNTLKTYYAADATAGSWTTGTVPSLIGTSAGSSFSDDSRIVTTNSGFVISYADYPYSGDGRSGILYSTDGITFSAATIDSSSNFYKKLMRVFNNPLQ